MTGSDVASVSDAANFVRSSLGETPAFACVAERGAISPETIAGDGSTCWQSAPASGGPAPYKLYCSRANGVPLLLIIETPPFQSARTRTFAAKLASKCGCEALFVITTAIPLIPNFLPGELMVVSDHVNLLGDSPLIGHRSEGASFAFCDLANAYDQTLQDDVVRAARTVSLAAHSGIYVASPLAERPDTSALETLCESGGHACGTGLVPHVLVARDASLKVVALSRLTDPGSATVSENPPQFGTKPWEALDDRLSQLARELLGQWSRRGVTGSRSELARLEDGEARN